MHLRDLSESLQRRIGVAVLILIAALIFTAIYACATNGVIPAHEFPTAAKLRADALSFPSPKVWILREFGFRNPFDHMTEVR